MLRQKERGKLLIDLQETGGGQVHCAVLPAEEAFLAELIDGGLEAIQNIDAELVLEVVALHVAGLELQDQFTDEAFFVFECHCPMER